MLLAPVTLSYRMTFAGELSARVSMFSIVEFANARIAQANALSELREIIDPAARETPFRCPERESFRHLGLGPEAPD